MTTQATYTEPAGQCMGCGDYAVTAADLRGWKRAVQEVAADRPTGQLQEGQLCGSCATSAQWAPFAEPRFVVRRYRHRYQIVYKVIDSFTGKSVATAIWGETSAKEAAAHFEKEPPAAKPAKDADRADCQICGRPIKAKRGRIAHHGYRRPGHGWQTPSCPGATFLPYSESRDRIQPVIKDVQRYIEHSKERKATLLAEPPASLPYTPSWKDKAEDIERPADFSVVEALDRTSRRDFGRYGKLYSGILRGIDQDISGSEETKLYLQNRFDSWKAKA